MEIDTSIGWIAGAKESGAGVTDVGDALREYGMDWNVELHPVSTRIYSGGREIKRRIDDNKAVVRMSDYAPLAVVGNDYTPIQHREAFGVLDMLVGDGKLVIDRVQSIKDGRKVMVVTRAPEPLMIAGEPTMRYQAWLNGHDGKTPVVMVPVPTRVFCTNALRFSPRSRVRDAYKIRHTKTAPARLLEAQTEMFGANNLDAELRELTRNEAALREDAGKALGVADQYEGWVRDVGEDLARVKFNERDFEKLLKKVIPTSEDANARTLTVAAEKRAEIRMIWQSSDDLDNIRYTAWGALNACLAYNDHHRGFRTTDSKTMGLIGGGGITQRAFDALSVN